MIAGIIPRRADHISVEYFHAPAVFLLDRCLRASSDGSGGMTMSNAPVELSALTEESTCHAGPIHSGPLAFDATVDRGADGLAEASRAGSLPQTGAFVQIPPSGEGSSLLEPWLQDALMKLQRTRLSEPLPARFQEPLYELQRLLGRASRTRR
ncbi:MAG TPA: hypothetical protein VL462_00725 [Candidatus Nitrosotalea sp.]|nr:hypothetical protein [Candidatus Nitrosotalea sp.]